MNQKQKGFGILPLLLIILIIGALGFSGWYVWQKQKTSDQKSTAQTTTTSPTDSQTTAPPAAKPEPEPILKVYTNASYGLSFKYPDDWKLTEKLENWRGEPEGDVTVLSPSGTNVTFNLNLGGKGGDCWDDTVNDRSTRRCTTVEYSNITKLNAQENLRNITFYHVKITDGDEFGGKTHYEIGLADDYWGELPTTPTLTPIYMSSLFSRPGYIVIKVTGKEDDQKSSTDYFSTRQVKEATPILKSVTVIKR